ncbi:hypothetical protein [Ligilactobacillus sp. 110_WCHN]|uniref:hypothetical protein n=1 Tax=Ligilactobacillus sp. 110_WCHN TaxID=3057125 RepID=UPI0026732FB3|nr:hypothetical protein [Ligilactobacillus sp. 110_WCHN]MDO3393911.1 hypothetical protein [Ligilactobacillus sp. 110_WCHN]
MNDEKFESLFNDVVSNLSSELNSEQSKKEIKDELDLANTKSEFVSAKISNYYSRRLIHDVLKAMFVNKN